MGFMYHPLSMYTLHVTSLAAGYSTVQGILFTLNCEMDAYTFLPGEKKQTFQFFGAFVSIVVVLFEGPYRWC